MVLPGSWKQHFLSCHVNVTFAWLSRGRYLSPVTVLKMLLLSNRVKFCSLAFTAARLYSSGPATANKNPTVYFDIAAESEHLGRVTFEVNVEFTLTLLFSLFTLDSQTWRFCRLAPWVSRCDALCRSSMPFIYIFAAQRGCCAENCG